MDAPGAGPGPRPGAGTTASEPDAAADRMADGEWHRLHPATPLLRGGIGLVAVLGVVVANLRERLTGMFMSFVGVRGYDDDTGDPVDEIVRHGMVGWALLVIAVLLLLALGVFYLSWRMHTFRIGEDAVEVRRGIISRHHRKARLDRIQGVNLSKPLFARLFGTAKLEVSVAGQDANVELAYLGTALATALRRDILVRASGVQRRTRARAARPDGARGGAAAAVPGAVMPRPAEPGSAPQVPAAPTIDASAIAPLPADAVPTIGARASDLITRRYNDFLAPHYDPDAAPPRSAVTIPPLRLFGSIIISGFTIALVILVAAVVTGVATGHYWVLVALLPTVLAWGGVYGRRFTRSMNYSIVDTADGIRVGFGLLSTSNETIPPGRIHAVEVLQPLIWRGFGWWQIRIATAGHSKQKGAAGQANTTILPVGDARDVERVLGLIVPSLADGANVALVTAGMRETGAEALTSTVGFSVPPRRAAWLRPFSWRRTGSLVTDTAVLVRTGAVWRRLSVVPLARMQSVELRQGPVRRLLGLVRCRLHTVDGPVHAAVPVVGEADGVGLFHRVAAAAVAAAQREHDDGWGAEPGLGTDATGGLG